MKKNHIYLYFLLISLFLFGLIFTSNIRDPLDQIGENSIDNNPIDAGNSNIRIYILGSNASYTYKGTNFTIYGFTQRSVSGVFQNYSNIPVYPIINGVAQNINSGEIKNLTVFSAYYNGFEGQFNISYQVPSTHPVNSNLSFTVNSTNYLGSTIPTLERRYIDEDTVVNIDPYKKFHEQNIISNLTTIQIQLTNPTKVYTPNNTISFTFTLRDEHNLAPNYTLGASHFNIFRGNDSSLIPSIGSIFYDNANGQGSGSFYLTEGISYFGINFTGNKILNNNPYYEYQPVSNFSIHNISRVQRIQDNLDLNVINLANKSLNFAHIGDSLAINGTIYVNETVSSPLANQYLDLYQIVDAEDKYLKTFQTDSNGYFNTSIPNTYLILANKEHNVQFKIMLKDYDRNLYLNDANRTLTIMYWIDDIVSLDSSNLDVTNLANITLEYAFPGDLLAIHGDLRFNGLPSVQEQALVSKPVSVYLNGTYIAKNTTTSTGFFYYQFTTTNLPNTPQTLNITLEYAVTNVTEGGTFENVTITTLYEIRQINSLNTTTSLTVQNLQNNTIGYAHSGTSIRLFGNFVYNTNQTLRNRQISVFINNTFFNNYVSSNVGYIDFTVNLENYINANATLVFKFQCVIATIGDILSINHTYNYTYRQIYNLQPLSITTTNMRNNSLTHAYLGDSIRMQFEFTYNNRTNRLNQKSLAFYQNGSWIQTKVTSITGNIEFLFSTVGFPNRNLTLEFTFRYNVSDDLDPLNLKWVNFTYLYEFRAIDSIEASIRTINQHNDSQNYVYFGDYLWIDGNFTYDHGLNTLNGTSLTLTRNGTLVHSNVTNINGFVGFNVSTLDLANKNQMMMFVFNYSVTNSLDLESINWVAFTYYYEFRAINSIEASIFTINLKNSTQNHAYLGDNIWIEGNFTYALENKMIGKNVTLFRNDTYIGYNLTLDTTNVGFTVSTMGLANKDQTIAFIFQYNITDSLDPESINWVTFQYLFEFRAIDVIESDLMIINTNNESLPYAYLGQSILIIGNFTFDSGLNILAGKSISLFRNNTLIGTNTTLEDGNVAFIVPFTNIPNMNLTMVFRFQYEVLDSPINGNIRYANYTIIYYLHQIKNLNSPDFKVVNLYNESLNYAYPDNLIRLEGNFTFDSNQTLMNTPLYVYINGTFIGFSTTNGVGFYLYNVPDQKWNNTNRILNITLQYNVSNSGVGGSLNRIIFQMLYNIRKIGSIDTNLTVVNLSNSTNQFANKGDKIALTGHFTFDNATGLLSERFIEVYLNGERIGQNKTSNEGYFYYEFDTSRLEDANQTLTWQFKLVEQGSPAGITNTSIAVATQYTIEKIPVPVTQQAAEPPPDVTETNWVAILIPVGVVVAIIVGIVIFQRKRMDLAHTKDLRMRRVNKNTKLALIENLFECGKGREGIAYTYHIYLELIKQKYRLEKEPAITIREFGITMVTKFGQDPLHVYPYIQLIEGVIYGAIEINKQSFEKAMTLFGRLYNEITGVQLEYGIGDGNAPVEDIQIEVKQPDPSTTPNPNANSNSNTNP